MTVAELMALLSAYDHKSQVDIGCLDKTRKPYGANSSERLSSQHIYAPVADVTMLRRRVIISPAMPVNVTIEPQPPTYRSHITETLTALQPDECTIIDKPSTSVSAYTSVLQRKYPGRRFRTETMRGNGSGNQTKVWRVE